MHPRALRRERRERRRRRRGARRGAELCRRAEGAVPREQAHAGAEGRVHREEQQDRAPGTRLTRPRSRGAHAEHAQVRHQAQGRRRRERPETDAAQERRAAAVARFAADERGPGIVPVVRRERRRIHAVAPCGGPRARQGGDGCARQGGGCGGTRGRMFDGASPRASRRRRGGAFFAVRCDVTRREGDQGEGQHRHSRALRLLRRARGIAGAKDRDGGGAEGGHRGASPGAG